MPGAYIHPQVRLCVVRLSAIFPINEISILLDVSESTMQRILELFEHTGRIVPLPGAKRGRKMLFENSDHQFLENVLSIDNDKYLDELQDIMFDRTGKKASLATISRSTARLGISNKQLTRAASERDPLRRASYMAEIGLLYKPDQLVFIDECYIDKRNTARLRGWAKRGAQAPSSTPFVRGRRFTILPALSLDGVLDVRAFEGSCNGNRFIQFIEGLMMEMRPFPEKNSVLVMDNVGFHHNDQIQPLADERGIRLVYLSPYSPDYNPIEEGFSAVKAWVRRNNSLVRAAMESEDEEEAIMMLTFAVMTVMTSENAKGWFADSGYF